MTNAAIELSDVRFDYEDMAMRFDLAVAPGEFLAIIGPHRARAATHPAGRNAPPEAGFSCPLATLRSACGARHHGANRA
jgi:hypothetical protein